MLEHIKRVSRHSLIYSLGSMAEKGVGFLLVPVYTRHLTPDDYGVLGLLVTIQGTLILFATMGVAGGLAMAYNQKEGADEQRKAVGTAVAATSFGGLLLAVLAAIFAEPLSQVTFNTSGYTLHIRMVAGTLLAEALILIAVTVLRVREQSSRYVAVTLIKFIAAVILNVLFVVILGWGVKGVLLSSLITTAATSLYLIPYVIRSAGFAFSWSKLKGMAAFGAPYIPSNILGQVMSLSDRYFIQFMIGSAELGLYSLGSRFGLVISTVLVAPFLAAWGPFFWAIHQQDNAMEVYARITTYYVLATSAAALCLAMLAKEAIQIVATEDFYPAYRVIGLIAVAWAIRGAVNLMSLGIGLAKKTWWVPLITVIGAVMNLGLNWLMVPRWGMEGAAVATVLSFSVLPVLMLLVSRRYHKVPYEWTRIGKVVSVAMLIFLFSLAVNMESTVSNAMVKCILLLLFPTGLYVVRFFRQDEIVKLKEIARI